MKIIIFAILIVSTSAFAAIQKIQATGGEVDFLAIGKPSFIKIHGTGAPSKGTISLDGEKISSELEFDLDSLNTGISKRDEHMKTKYLETSKYPQAKLELKSVTPLKGWSLQKPDLKDAEFEGILTLHGQSQPVKGKFSINDKLAADVSFKIKLSDFKVDIPTFAGVTVADDVEINVKIDKLGAL
jgi:polyisoprenoid-binding protein YceI